jgi:hypothetical protein
MTAFSVKAREGFDAHGTMEFVNTCRKVISF